MDEGGGKSRPTVGVPVHLSRTPGSIRHFAPEIGEHNEEVLLESGFTRDEVAQLFESGAFGARKPKAAQVGTPAGTAGGGGA